MNLLDLILQDLDLPGPGCHLSFRYGPGVELQPHPGGRFFGRQPDWKVLGHDVTVTPTTTCFPGKNLSFFHSISTVSFKHMHQKSVSKLVRGTESLWSLFG